MLRSFRQINIRSHQDTTLRLEPLTLLVGPTGSGKSNIFRALILLQSTLHRPTSEIFGAGPGEFQWVRSRWAQETDPLGFEVEVDVEGVFALYKLRFADSPQGVFILEESLQQRSGEADWSWVFQQRFNGKPNLGAFGAAAAYGPTVLNRVWRSQGVVVSAADVQFAKKFANTLSRVGYFHLEASSLKAIGDREPSKALGYTGTRLPEFIEWVKSQPDTALYERIRAQMQQALPHLLEIILNPVGGGQQQGVAMSFKDQRGFTVARDLSDGTMFTLGLLAILLSESQPELICIEEPETGLHPRRLRWLFEQVLSVAYPVDGSAARQVVLTTHSPFLVDLFKDMQSAVQIVDQNEGRSRVRSLTEVKTSLGADASESPGFAWATGLYEGE